MTLVSDIIRRAHRESNLIPLGATPSAAQITEALELFNTLIMSTVGNEVGDELSDFNYGGTYDQSSWLNQWVPDNLRLIFNLTAAVSLNTDPYPYEGQRLAFVDAKNNLATYNVTLNGSGRLIEGATTLTLNTNGETRQWIYRADIGSWTKIATLLSSDAMPFPVEFDDYFAVMLGLRINPRYGQELSTSTFEALKRTRGQIRSRYRAKNLYVGTDPGLLNPNDDNYYGRGDTSNYFNKGGTLPWA